MKVTVSDTGRGIRQQDEEIIYSPYKQIRDPVGNTKGYGLGLTITKKIIEQFGGELGFRPNAGKGTQFFFTFEYEENLEKEPSLLGINEEEKQKE